MPLPHANRRVGTTAAGPCDACGPTVHFGGGSLLRQPPAAAAAAAAAIADDANTDIDPVTGTNVATATASAKVRFAKVWFAKVLLTTGSPSGAPHGGNFQK